MKLSELKTKGALNTGALVKKTVEWSRIDDNGETQTETFEVGIVARLGWGSVSRIYNRDDGYEKGVKLIAESVRLGDDFSEALTYGDVAAFLPSLGSALLNAVTEVQGARAAPKAATEGEA